MVGMVYTVHLPNKEVKKKCSQFVWVILDSMDNVRAGQAFDSGIKGDWPEHGRTEVRSNAAIPA
jgi:hypothetical protein